MAWWQAPQSAEGVAVPCGKSLDGVTAAGAGGAGAAGAAAGGGVWAVADPATRARARRTIFMAGSRGRRRGLTRWRRYGSGVTISASKWVSESALVQTPARPALEKVASVASRMGFPSQWT